MILMQFFSRFPLKAVRVMHTVSLRTEATLGGAGAQASLGLGQVFKVFELSRCIFVYFLSYLELSKYI